MASPTVPTTDTGPEDLEEIRRRLTPDHFIEEGAPDKVFLTGLLQRLDLAPMRALSFREKDRECPEMDRQLIELHECAAAVVRDELQESGWVEPEIVALINAVADLLESQRYYVLQDGRWVRDMENIAIYREVMARPESVPRA